MCINFQERVHPAMCLLIVTSHIMLPMFSLKIKERHTLKCCSLWRKYEGYHYFLLPLGTSGRYSGKMLSLELVIMVVKY